MHKRVKLNSYEPLVRDKNMKFVTRSWYNKIFPFVKPFEFLKRNKIFQCELHKIKASVILYGCRFGRGMSEDRGGMGSG